MPPSKKRNPEYVRRFKIAAHAAKWAVIMAKVGIRRALADNPWAHWHILSFTGPDGRESRGVVDLIAARKHHSEPSRGTKRGDALQVILIQFRGAEARPNLQRKTRPGCASLPAVIELAASC
jgi:hypothetical protein